MKKWILTGMLVLLLMGMQAGYAHANPTGTDVLPEAEETIEPSPLNVLVPQKDRVTSRRTMVVSFSAPQGSLVTVEVFHNSSLTEEEYYTALYEPMDFEIGVLERGWVELQLKKGKNKLLFTAQLPEEENTVEAVPPVTVERYITVKDLEEVRAELTRNVMQTSASDLIRRLTNMEPPQ